MGGWYGGWCVLFFASNYANNQQILKIKALDGSLSDYTGINISFGLNIGFFPEILNFQIGVGWPMLFSYLGLCSADDADTFSRL